MPTKKLSTSAIPLALALLIGANETQASGTGDGRSADAMRITRISPPDPATIPFPQSRSPIDGTSSLGAPAVDIVPLDDPAYAGTGAGAVSRDRQKFADAETAAAVPTKGIGHHTAQAQLAATPQRTVSWRDGERTIALTLTEEGRQPGKGSAAAAVDDPTVPQPVFRSHSGTPMTLPGGVLLKLDPSWSDAEVEMFFENSGIGIHQVLTLDYLPNGFFVETEAGIGSLELANALAGQKGVEASSPNWRRRVQTR